MLDKEKKKYLIKKLYGNNNSMLPINFCRLIIMNKYMKCLTRVNDVVKDIFIDQKIPG